MPVSMERWIVWGSTEIRLPGKANPTSTPVLDENQVYLTLEEGKVYAASIESEEPVWSTQLNGSVSMVPSVSTHLYMADSTGTLYAFDKSSGDEQFTIDVGTDVAGACMTEDMLYVSGEKGSDGVLLAHDPASGEEIWSLETDKPLTNSPVVVDGVLFVGDDDGTLHTYVDESEKESFRTPEAQTNTPS